MFRDFFWRSRRARGEDRASAQGDPPPYRLPDGLRVYAIGDIHGRADLLDALEQRVRAHVAAHPLSGDGLVIFLGDYIDRGPKSREVLDRLARPGYAGLPTRYLRGNHEEAMLRFLAAPVETAEWLAWGGLATLASYGVGMRLDQSKAALIAARQALADALPVPHLAFMNRLELAIELGDYLFVHAGVRPGAPLHEQRREDLLEIREPFLSHGGRLPWRVVHGHTVLPQAVFAPSRISLDTGAYASGRLSCAVIEGDTASLLEQ